MSSGRRWTLRSISLHAGYSGRAAWIALIIPCSLADSAVAGCRHLTYTLLACFQIATSTSTSRPVITEVTDRSAAIPTSGPGPAAAGGVDPGVQMRQMAAMLRSNPAMLDTMEGLMANMSQEQLDSMVRGVRH